MARLHVVPRSLAGQAVALQLAVLVVIVLAGSALAVEDARVDADRAARAEVTAVAVALATAPSTAAAITSPDPTSLLQPVTERVRAQTGIAFITIMNTAGIRYTHTDPQYIGQRYLGTTAQALRGETYTETYTGTLGPSVRTLAPVRGRDGVIVGMVAAGITQATLTENWMSQLPLITAIAGVALLVAGVGLWAIRRRVRRHTGGLAPAELRVMYDHHDAVLHAIREGLIVLDGARPVLVNDEARRLLAPDVQDPVHEPAQMTGESLAAETTPADVDPMFSIPEFLSQGVEPLRDVLYAEGGRVLLVNRSPVPGRPEGAVITVRDRTEVAEAMGELDAMTRFAEALRSQAHESANRLHTIVALIEMGRTGDAVRVATENLELSKQLVARVSDAVVEPTLAALLLGKTAQAAERGITLTLTEDSMTDDDAIQVLSPAEMITVVGNLVDNALDAADPADPWVEVTVIGNAAHLRIVVADSGSGMTPEQFTRARRRGYSTKSGGDEAGRGLGLALASQVIERRGGTIRAENTYGSVVTVDIDSGGEGPIGSGAVDRERR